MNLVNTVPMGYYGLIVNTVPMGYYGLIVNTVPEQYHGLTSVREAANPAWQ